MFFTTGNLFPHWLSTTRPPWSKLDVMDCRGIPNRPLLPAGRPACQRAALPATADPHPLTSDARWSSTTPKKLPRKESNIHRIEGGNLISMHILLWLICMNLYILRGLSLDEEISFFFLNDFVFWCNITYQMNNFLCIWMLQLCCTFESLFIDWHRIYH